MTSRVIFGIPFFTLVSDIPLGEGGFGKVWHVKHTIDEKEYALKQIPIGHALSHLEGDFKKLFGEVKILQELDHPNILRYHSCWLSGPQVIDGRLPTDFGAESVSSTNIEQNFLSIQTELCKSTLKQFIADCRKGENTDADQMTQIILQVSTGLEFLHRKQIVHRDIKPSNILQTVSNEQSTWKIADFGLAVNFGDKMEASVAGQREYRSPDEFTSYKSDIYSLGVTFLQVVDNDFDPPLDPDYEPRKDPIVQDILLNMVDKNADNRPTAGDALTRFQKLFEIEPEIRVKYKGRSLVEPFWFDVPQAAKNFSGRSRQLDVLKTSINFDDSSIEIRNLPCVVLVVGLGGIGKSELLKKFFQEVYTSKSANCIWINSDTPESFLKSFRNLAKRLACDPLTNDGFSAFDFLQIVNKIPDLPVALHLENVDNLNELLVEFLQSFSKLPESSNNFLLTTYVTTRNRGLFESLEPIEIIELDVLQPSESLTMLKSSSVMDPSKEDFTDAVELFESLQNFPLALQQAVGYIKYRRVQKAKLGGSKFRLREYLKLFSEEKKKLQLLNHKLAISHNYSFTTVTTWSINFQFIKSHPELGTLAEEVFLLWSYCFQPDGEEVTPFINFLEVLQTANFEKPTPISLAMNTQLQWLLKRQHRNLWCPRKNLNPESAIFRVREVPIELEDDDRLAAQAIKLIMSLSLCGLKLQCNSSGMDIEFVSMHRLVQEIVRLNQTDEKKYTWLLKLFKKFSSASVRDWSAKSQENFMHREAVLGHVFSYLNQNAEVVEQYTNLIYDIWEDCKPGYVPKIGIDVLKDCIRVSRNHLTHAFVVTAKYAFIKELEFLQRNIHKDNPQKFLPLENGNTSDTENIIIFYQNVIDFVKDHDLYYEVTGLLLRFVFHSKLPAEHDKIVPVLKQVLYEVINIFHVNYQTLDTQKWYTLLCLTGRLCDYLSSTKQLEDFCREIIQHVTITLGVNPNKFQYMFKLLFNHLRIKNMQDSDEFKYLMEITNNFAVDGKFLAGINCTFSEPPSNMALTIFNEVINSPQETWTRVSSMSLDKISYFLPIAFCSTICTGLLTCCMDLCSRNQFAAAREFITVARKIESRVWEDKYADECFHIMKDSVFPLCQFSKDFVPSYLLQNWIDEFIQRWGSIQNSINLPLPSTESESSIPSQNGPTLQLAVPLMTENLNVTLSTIQELSISDNYESLTTQTENLLRSLESTSFKWYVKSKMADIISKTIFAQDSHFLNIPPNQLSWSVVFVLQNSLALSQLIEERKTLLTCIETICKDSPSVGRELAEIAKTIVSQQEERNNPGLDSFWYLIYGVIIASQVIMDMDFFSQIFGFDDDLPREDWFSSLTIDLAILMAKTESSQTYAIPSVLTSIFSLMLDISESPTCLEKNETAFREIVDQFISDCWNYQLYADIVLLSQRISDITVSLEKSMTLEKHKVEICVKIRTYYGIPAICRRCNIIPHEGGSVSSTLSMLYLWLKFLPGEEKRRLAPEELKRLSDECVNRPVNLQLIFIFLLIHEGLYFEEFSPNLQILMGQILDNRSRKEEYLQIYEFGLEISFLAPENSNVSKLVQECLQTLIACLANVFETNFERAQRLITSKIEQTLKPVKIDASKGNIEALNEFKDNIFSMLDKYHNANDLVDLLNLMDKVLVEREDVYKSLDIDMEHFKDEPTLLELD